MFFAIFIVTCKPKERRLRNLGSRLRVPVIIVGDGNIKFREDCISESGVYEFIGRREFLGEKALLDLEKALRR